MQFYNQITFCCLLAFAALKSVNGAAAGAVCVGGGVGDCDPGHQCLPTTPATDLICVKECAADTDCPGSTCDAGPPKVCASAALNACNAVKPCTTPDVCNFNTLTCIPPATTTTVVITTVGIETTTVEATTTTVGTIGAIGLRSLGQSCTLDTTGVTACFSCSQSVTNLAGENVCTTACVVGTAATCPSGTCVSRTNTATTLPEPYCNNGAVVQNCISNANCYNTLTSTSGTCNPYTLTCTYLTSSVTTCRDAVTGSANDCGSLASRGFCTNTLYVTLMRSKCARSCGYCTTTSTSTGCADLINPRTGVSDCPSRSGYCTVSVYRSLMRTQCPLTCGFCFSG
uniref:ShK domain-containing protein n=1 Tax=Rhabditophanes sp. KR3021 TaxID=114890 RepID=A0AC35TWC7_9BILA